MSIQALPSDMVWLLGNIAEGGSLGRVRGVQGGQGYPVSFPPSVSLLVPLYLASEVYITGALPVY